MVKLLLFQIDLNKKEAHCLYKPGEVISGTVQINLAEREKINCVSVKT